MMRTPIEHVAEIARALNEVPGVQLAYVFGSVARHEAGPDSDIDIAVLAKQQLGSIALLDIQRSIAEITGRAVDVVDLRRAGQPVLGEVMKDGVRLIGDAASHADLATRAAVEYSDFFPYVQQVLATRRQAWIG